MRYIYTAFFFFFTSGLMALVMRQQLAAPNNHVLGPEAYNQLFTTHGTTMIFLFVVPMMAGLANYFLPLMIGARDVAYPRLNALSYWLLLAGGIVFYASILFNPPEAGWTSYPPLSDSRRSIRIRLACCTIGRGRGATRPGSLSSRTASSARQRADRETSL